MVVRDRRVVDDERPAGVADVPDAHRVLAGEHVLHGRQLGGADGAQRSRECRQRWDGEIRAERLRRVQGAVRRPFASPGVERVDADRRLPSQQHGELLDGGLDRQARIGGPEPVAGGQHRPAQQAHRPGAGDRAVVVAQADHGAGVGEQVAQLIVVLGGDQGPEVDDTLGGRRAWPGRIAELVPRAPVEVVAGDEHPRRHHRDPGVRGRGGEGAGGDGGVEAPRPTAGDQQTDRKEVVAVELEVAQVAGRDQPATGVEVRRQRSVVEVGRLDRLDLAVALAPLRPFDGEPVIGDAPPGAAP